MTPTIRIYLLLFTLLLIHSPAYTQISWRQAGPQEQIIDITSGNGRVYVLSHGGLYVSSDDKLWTKLRPTAAAEAFNSIVALRSGDLFLFSYNSYLTSSNGGTSWRKVNQSQFSTRKCISDAMDYLYSGQNDPIQCSTDKGVTWFASQAGTSASFFDIGALAVAPNGDIYAGNQGISGGLVYRSTNQGMEWSLVHSEEQSDVVAIEVGNGSIWISYSTKLLRSQDDGLTWTTVLQAPSPYATAILFTSVDNGYLGLAQTGLFRSVDSGNSWFNGDDGIRGKRVAKIFKTPNNNVLVGTDSGLFVSYLLSTVERTAAADPVMTLTPNPADTKVTVECSDLRNTENHVDIFDQLGRRRLSMEKVSQSFSLNTSTFEPGAYFLVVRSSHGQWTRRLLIAR